MTQAEIVRLLRLVTVPRLTISEIARQAGLSRRTLERAMLQNRMSQRTADALDTALTRLAQQATKDGCYNQRSAAVYEALQAIL
jgi:transposase-like protein